MLLFGSVKYLVVNIWDVIKKYLLFGTRGVKKYKFVTICFGYNCEDVNIEIVYYEVKQTLLNKHNKLHV